MKHFAQAVRPLAADFLSTLVFVAMTLLHVDLRYAILSAVVVGVGQVVWLRWRGLPVASLQWLSLGLVLVSGLAGLLTHDARFVMAKPSVVCLLIAWAMMERGWMLRYVPPVAKGRVDDLMIGFGYAWAAMMALTAAANLVVAVMFPERWALFISVVPLVTKFALFGVQFAIVRVVAGRRIRAARMVSAGATAPLHA